VAVARKVLVSIVDGSDPIEEGPREMLAEVKRQRRSRP
jgi:hypothetical protein